MSQFANKESRIKLINHEINQGAAQARFTGLSGSKSRYIMFLDADDWLSKNALQVMYDKIETEQSDVVHGSIVRVLDRHKIFKSKPKNVSMSENRTTSIVQPKLFETYFISYFGYNLLFVTVWGKLYRKSTIDKAQPEPTKYRMGEDLMFNLKLHPFLTKISFVTDTVYYYRFGGMTSSSNPHFLDDIKSQYILKECYINDLNYQSAAPFIRYEAINCFFSHFQNLILMDNFCEESVEKLIQEELKDDFYNNNLFEGIIMAEKEFALQSGDSERIMAIIKARVKKERPKFILKKLISKII